MKKSSRTAAFGAVGARAASVNERALALTVAKGVHTRVEAFRIV